MGLLIANFGSIGGMDRYCKDTVFSSASGEHNILTQRHIQYIQNCEIYTSMYSIKDSHNM